MTGLGKALDARHAAIDQSASQTASLRKHSHALSKNPPRARRIRYATDVKIWLRYQMCTRSRTGADVPGVTPGSSTGTAYRAVSSKRSVGPAQLETAGGGRCSLRCPGMCDADRNALADATPRRAPLRKAIMRLNQAFEPANIGFRARAEPIDQGRTRDRPKDGGTGGTTSI